MTTPIQLDGPYRSRSTLRRARTTLLCLAIFLLLIASPLLASAVAQWLKG